MLKKSASVGDSAFSRVYFRLKGRLVEGIIDHDVGVPAGEDGLIFMREYLAQNKVAPRDGFFEGFVGFVSYDLGYKWVIGNSDSVSAPPFSEVPEVYFVYVKDVRPMQVEKMPFSSRTNIFAGSTVRNLSKQDYFRALSEIEELIFSGETYQVNFSQLFSRKWKGDPFKLFEYLVSRNPSSRDFFMETENFALISNSPECLMTINANGLISTRPIKGTVARGLTLAEDKARVRELLASKKDEAELTMIVDLERNDLGKVCVPGSVHVTEHRAIEKYAHVIHTASTVEGMMGNRQQVTGNGGLHKVSSIHGAAQAADWLDAFRALFPGGSVTGCPKKRTMEIIRRLEASPRGIYCGSAGWIDLSGACDFSILIRTMWYDKKNSELSFRTGGGIVADSNAESEYNESLQKAQTLLGKR